MIANKIQISPNGPVFSRIVAGVWKWGQWGWKLNDQQHLSLIQSCLEQEVTTFDHADIYGDYTSEADFGRALQLQPSLREKMQIVTKCGIKLKSNNRPNHKIKSYDLSKEHIITSVENSLRNLHTDRIDLLLLHRPSPLMDADDVAEAIIQLKKQGKILHFGVSNFTPSQFKLIQSRLEIATNQIELHLMKPKPF
ncbi:MAG: aldo/keto reductase, partial [Saprospiraceae bacterium]